DPAKLAWVNQQHLMRTPVEHVAPALGEQLARYGCAPEDGPPLELAVEAFRERSQTLAEMAERAVPYYGELGNYDPAAAKAQLQPTARPPLAALREALAALEEWTEQSTQGAVERVAND